jgi:predicted nucleic acid-binding protein
LRADDVDLHVPALCDVEVVAGLRRTVLRRAVSSERAAEAIQDYLDLPISRHGHSQLLARILELRPNFSACDATYVALAERLAAALLTADERLARAVRTHTEIRVALP